MPKIEYNGQKIKRKFSSEWATSGNIPVDVPIKAFEDWLPRYIKSLISSRDTMVEYIELLHDEIDRLNSKK